MDAVPMNYREPNYSSNACNSAPAVKSELWAANTAMHDSPPPQDLATSSLDRLPRYGGAIPALGADSMLRIKTVIELSGLSRSSIYSYIKDGKFPPQCKIGERAIGWRASTIFEWISTRTSGA